MTFNKVLVGVFVTILSSYSLASKQVISCQNEMRIILFGTQTVYGERFVSGLALPQNNGSQVTLTYRVHERDETALFAGTDYDGNRLSVEIPKDAVGAVVQNPFPVLSQSAPRSASPAQSRTICVSQLAE